MYRWPYLKDRPLQVYLDPSIADTDKRSYIRKVVIDYTMKTSFSDLNPLLKELWLIPWLIDLLMSMMKELWKGLLVFDPICELSNRIDDKQARDDSIGQVISLVDGVYNGQDESG